MFKFVVKLAILVIGIYILIQIPFIREKIEGIKLSFDQKVENVENEVTRVKGEIDDVKEKIDQTKETITGITDKVKDTAEAVEGAMTTLNEAHDTVEKMLSGEEGETVPEPQAETMEESSNEDVTWDIDQTEAFDIN